MNEIIVDIIGFTAGILMAVTMIPQIIQSIKTKSVRDISLLMLVIYVTSAFLWMIYGILIKSLPVAITDGFAFCVSSTQLYLKIKYTKKVASPRNSSDLLCKSRSSLRSKSVTRISRNSGAHFLK